ncbi:MAG: ABC transporter permease [Planctomycetes bacterium]|nr:ABC transporter permease [Planctomycetota bacterium]
MSLFFLVRKSLRQHALSSVVTIVCVALGAGLMMSVFSLSQQAEKAFRGGGFGFDAVLGARSSKIALIMNAVFHVEPSPGNLPWQQYLDIKQDRRVKFAIPYALGDNYLGYRVVGTTPELFVDYVGSNGEHFEFGRASRVFDANLREAVIGSTVAERTGLRVGSTFQPYHGLTYNEGDAPHAEVYMVVGVLKPTNTPCDRVIWIPIDGVFRMEGHVLRGGGTEFEAQHVAEIPDEHKEVSAVMLQFTSKNFIIKFDQAINKQSKDRTLALISHEIPLLFERLGLFTQVLRYVAYLVVGVAAASILASVYNTMNERRREFAILRALGARRATVFTTIVLEAGTIALLGTLLGFAVYAAIFAVAAWFVGSQVGVILEIDFGHPIFWQAPLGLTLVGAVSGLVPAFKAYRTGVADNLIPTS